MVAIVTQGLGSSAMSAEPRRLTVAMIVRDAEDVIAASLESVRCWADEILVADTGSIDRTRQTAATRRACVIDMLPGPT